GFARPTARSRLGIGWRVDDQDIAMRAPRHVLADAATERPLDEAGLAGADDNQIGLLLLGKLDDLFGGVTENPCEVDRDSGACEERLHTLAVLLPERFV